MMTEMPILILMRKEKDVFESDDGDHDYDDYDGHNDHEHGGFNHEH